MKDRSDQSHLMVPCLRFGFLGHPGRLQPQMLPVAFRAAIRQGPWWDKGSRSAALPWRSFYREGMLDWSWESCSDGDRGCGDGMDGMGLGGMDGMGWDRMGWMERVRWVGWDGWEGG